MEGKGTSEVKWGILHIWDYKWQVNQFLSSKLFYNFKCPSETLCTKRNFLSCYLRSTDYFLWRLILHNNSHLIYNVPVTLVSRQSYKRHVHIFLYKGFRIFYHFHISFFFSLSFTWNWTSEHLLFKSVCSYLIEGIFGNFEGFDGSKDVQSSAVRLAIHL